MRIVGHTATARGVHYQGRVFDLSFDAHTMSLSLNGGVLTRWDERERRGGGDAQGESGGGDLVAGWQGGYLCGGMSLLE